MHLQKIKAGIHTIELYAANLKYCETQKVVDHLTDQKAIQLRNSDPYNIDRRMKSSYLIDQGINMRIHQSHKKSNGISFAVNPSTLLSSEYQPLKLFKPTKSNVRELLEQFKEVLDEVQLSHHGKLVVTPEELSLSRMDLTVDLYFSKDVNLASLIRIFRKSKCPRYYKRHELKGEKKHYFSIKTKKACFKVYDKIYELKKFDRCPPERQDQKILRLEITLKREKFLKCFNLKRDDDLYTMLNAGYKQIRYVLYQYLGKMFPACGTHWTYEKAVRKIKWSDLEQTAKEQMLFLVEKTSRGAGLDTAARKWEEAYRVVKKKEFDKMMRMFDKIDVNPITLGAKEGEIPCLRKMLEAVKFPGT
ncbi:hypothetical protein DWX58_00790 [Pseudoflavonifractor sp. AF19-9AC]|uniref:hypothetical protein n=1 Tax=Pseudoflavonifractor sp. AF19-9AC TaxID=2292244 RepID=UPI000E54BFB7|nr:hypothetical protein [Pseudoflavonifractor sp. AF19-9AC]RHR11030.1 hypothetical protein DWX58_00790 [Pseudoflavonifractor sp. AF19-9AC]